MKKPYSHLAWCEGRDSIRFMLMPWRANGLSTSNSAPGLSWMKTSTEVRSWPEGGKMLRPITRKRVVLSLSSWIGLMTTFFSPYTCAALSPPMAAASSLPRARRAPSALLDTGTFSTLGRLARSQPAVCAKDCGCA